MPSKRPPASTDKRVTKKLQFDAEIKSEDKALGLTSIEAERASKIARRVTRSQSRPTQAAKPTPIAEQSVSTSPISLKAHATTPKPLKASSRQAAKSYAHKWSVSPFPSHPHPTPTECQSIAKILSSHHNLPLSKSLVPVPPASLTRAGCGDSPAVHDALLRTVLSAATSGTNSAAAVAGILKDYGLAEEGVGKGSLDWEGVRKGGRERLEKAITVGGLGERKSGYIMKILDTITSENEERCRMIEENGGKLSEEDRDLLSLQHLKNLPTPEAFDQLIKYPGIGVKTAACVLLFCFQRPVYAVDTHVFRITKWLGWVPKECKDADSTFWHCQSRVPDDLMLPLHKLFWKHGRECYRCRADTRSGGKDWEQSCPIEEYVDRGKS